MTTDPHEIAEYAYRDEPDKDGISEDDHKIPFWFSFTFALTIAWAALYVPWYILSGWSSSGQWAAEVETATVRFADASPATAMENPFRGDQTAIAAGQQVWTTTCVACHKPDGSGLVGPSLVDPYWKYGNSDADLYETVDKGRPLGMPAWGNQLHDDEIWQVLAYMETLPRSDEPGMGAPEGWQPES